MEKKIITIYDIASEAKVSPATVSRVLTGNANVTTERKNRVLKLIDKYDFKPNILAKRLSDRRTGVLGIIMTDIRNPLCSELYMECEKVAHNSNYMLYLCNSTNDSRREFIYLNKLFEQRVDAIIIIGGGLDQVNPLQEYIKQVRKISAVIPVISNIRLENSDCYQVCVDQTASVDLTMKYLLKLGHKRICLMGGISGQRSFEDRKLKFFKILEKYSLPNNNGMVVEGKGTEENGYESMIRLLQYELQPTAIMAATDLTALGAIRAIYDHGMTVPGDYSITGFGNTLLSRYSWPTLTTIGFDYKILAKGLIQTAVMQLEGKEVPKVQLIKSELILNESCRNL